MSKKQFTLDSWLKDKSQKVVTRCGFPVRIVCTDVKRKDYPILALVERDDQEEYQSFTKYGRFSLYNPLHDNFDLFIETADEVCEDEKVRKALLEMVHDTTGDELWVDYNVHKEEALAWLEKQGEKKPVDDIQKPIGIKIHQGDKNNSYDMSFEDAQDYISKRGLDICLNDDDVFVDDRYITQTIGNVLRWADDNPKQKPADKVEPKFKVGDKIRRKTPSSFDKDMQVARIEKDYYVCNHIGKFSSEVVPFSKQSSYELIEQKPALGEEDETVLNNLIYALANDRIGNNRDEYIDWLKSLRPQNIYNPYKAVVESIAEMCKHYDKASHSGLRDFYDNVKVKCKDAQEYDKMFPQAQLKLSDEQIGLLQAIINEPNNASSESCQIVLKNILEQLKKLKKEQA